MKVNSIKNFKKLDRKNPNGSIELFFFHQNLRQISQGVRELGSDMQLQTEIEIITLIKNTLAVQPDVQMQDLYWCTDVRYVLLYRCQICSDVQMSDMHCCTDVRYVVMYRCQICTDVQMSDMYWCTDFRYVLMYRCQICTVIETFDSFYFYYWIFIKLGQKKDTFLYPLIRQSIQYYILIWFK